MLQSMSHEDTNAENSTTPQASSNNITASPVASHLDSIASPRTLPPPQNGVSVAETPPPSYLETTSTNSIPESSTLAAPVAQRTPPLQGSTSYIQHTATHHQPSGIATNQNRQLPLNLSIATTHARSNTGLTPLMEFYTPDQPPSRQDPFSQQFAQLSVSDHVYARPEVSVSSHQGGGSDAASSMSSGRGGSGGVGNVVGGSGSSGISGGGSSGGAGGGLYSSETIRTEASKVNLSDNTIDSSSREV